MNGRSDSAGALRDHAVLASLLNQATSLHRTVWSADAWTMDTYQSIWDLLQRARDFGREAFTTGVAMLGSGDAAARAVGANLLGTLCNPDEAGFGPDVTTTLIRLAAHEQASDVLWSIARSLGHTYDYRGLSTLIGLVGHPDSQIRLEVAKSLPSCKEGGDPEVLASALIALMSDSEGRVRNWATFGLGTLTELDGPLVREALFNGLHDEHIDARDEAMVGLARRRDRRVLPIVSARLGEESIGRSAVDAAAYLADESLLGPLRALEQWWRLDSELLDEALAACDPTRRIQEEADQATFMDLLEPRLSEFPEVRAWLACDRFDREAVLEVEQGGKVGRYKFASLVTDRADGDMRAAADAVLSDMLSDEGVHQ